MNVDGSSLPNGTRTPSAGLHPRLRRAPLLWLALLSMSCPNAERQSSPQAGGDNAPIESKLQPVASGLPPVAKGDLAAIKKRSVLRFLVGPIGEDFLPRCGMPNSHELEIAQQFATRLGVSAHFTSVESHSQLVELLNEGRGDIIAAQLIVTKGLGQPVEFTRPLATVSEWVVSGKQHDAERRCIGLRDMTIHVRASSSFAETLAAYTNSEGNGPTVVLVDEQLDTETLVYEVSQGDRPATVVDSYTLKAIEAYNPDIRRLFPIAHDRQIAWAIRHEDRELKAAADTFLMEKALTGHTEEVFVGDLDGIKKRGVLRVLTRNNPVSYFLHRGQQMGFDYELSRMVANELSLRLEMVVPPAHDELIPWLLDGRGDMIAASFTMTTERQKYVEFSRPYLYVDEVVVQRSKSVNGIATLAELNAKRIHVRKSSSYYRTLLALQRRYGPFEIVQVPEKLETEQLIGQVASREIDFTVSDSHILQVETAYRSDVEAGATLSATASNPEGKTKAIGFAVRPQSRALKGYLDAFVKKSYRGLHYNMARNRYFQNKRRIATAKATRTGVSGRISPYDDVIRRIAKRYGLDWRLMVAQAYQESRFDPNAKSWVGALGLFQVMPSTGLELGFTNLTDPDEGTHAGIKYMHRLIDRVDPSIGFKHRVRFALASYNAGYGHVLDAQRLAAQLGLDPHRWFGHVETTMRLLERPEYYRKARYGYCRGSEPVAYVSQIQNRYDNYVKLVPQ